MLYSIVLLYHSFYIYQETIQGDKVRYYTKIDILEEGIMYLYSPPEHTEIHPSKLVKMDTLLTFLTNIII